MATSSLSERLEELEARVLHLEIFLNRVADQSTIYGLQSEMHALADAVITEVRALEGSA